MATTENTSPSLIIIIDDIGNNYAKGKSIVDLDARITLAFLPHTPYATQLARDSFRSGKENMLHAPMENDSDAPLGPGALTPDMSADDFRTTLQKDIDAIPHVQGINNHMGSLLTRQSEPMKLVMETLASNQLYFVDSLTTPETVGFSLAQEYRVPALKRDVFLDNELSDDRLAFRWQQAQTIARKRGYAVLIAHPYPETAAFLKREIPLLQEIKLVTVSDHILSHMWQSFAHSELLPYNRFWLQHPVPQTPAQPEGESFRLTDTE